MSSGMPPAIVSTAALTIARGSIARYLSRSGSSTHDLSGSPSWSGTAAPPVPTITLAIRSGCAAAANRAADGPNVRRDDVGPAQISLGDELGQELAHRSRRQEILSAFGCAEPREVDGEQAGVVGKRAPHRRERVHALRPGAGEQDRPARASRRCRRTGFGLRPQSETGLARSLWSPCAAVSGSWAVLRARELPGRVPGMRRLRSCRRSSASGRLGLVLHPRSDPTPVAREAHELGAVARQTADRRRPGRRAPTR